MAMRARLEGNDQTLFHKTNSLQTETVWQKMQKGTSWQKEDEDTVIGKAAEVFISKEGRKLYEDLQEPLQKLTQTDFMIEGEKKLNELLAKKAEREECNKRADELEERLNSERDTALTLQEKISPITDNNLTGEDTKKIIKQAEKIKKITLEDALT